MEKNVLSMYELFTYFQLSVEVSDKCPTAGCDCFMHAGAVDIGQAVMSPAPSDTIKP